LPITKVGQSMSFWLAKEDLVLAVALVGPEGQLRILPFHA